MGRSASVARRIVRLESESGTTRLTTPTRATRLTTQSRVRATQGWGYWTSDVELGAIQSCPVVIANGPFQ